MTGIGMPRRTFLAGGLSLTAAAMAAEAPEKDGRGIRVRFLGTGVGLGGRRQSSVLLEGRVLIDLTPMSAQGLPAGVRPEAIFYTHSHGDHYDPSAALRAGVRRVYAHASWAEGLRREFAMAAERLGAAMPAVKGLAFGERVAEGNMTFTALPANHSTDRLTDGVAERTSMYLVEKGPSRLLYAVDTSGIPGDAARLIGIDPHIPFGGTTAPHVHRGAAITALIMEATMGSGAEMDSDYRMFMHSSVDMVARTARMLIAHKRLCPPQGQPVYLTHMAVGYDHVSGAIPAPLVPAQDGLEVCIG